MSKEKPASSLSQKAGVILFARILTTVIDLAMAIVLVRLLSKADFAVFSYILLIYESARYLANQGFPDSVFYFFERVSKNARKAFVWQTISIVAALSLVSGVFILLMSYFVPSLVSEWDPIQQNLLTEFLPIVALIAILDVPTWPVGNVLIAADLQKDAAWFEILKSCMTLLFIVGPLFLGYDVRFAVYGFALYAFLRALISYAWIWIRLPASTDSLEKGLLKEQFRFSIPLGMAAVVNKMNRQVDKFIVAYFLAETAMAEYNVGAQEVPIIRVIPFAIGSVLISKFVSLQMQDKKEELLLLWYKGIEKVALLVVPLTIMMIVLAPDFIVTLFGEEYLNAVIPFQIYNAIVLIRVTNYGSILQAFNDTNAVMRLSLQLFVKNIVFTIPLTMFFGISGAALATLIANITNWIDCLVVIAKHMGIKWYKVLPFDSYLKNMGVASITGFLVWSLRMTLDLHEYGLRNFTLLMGLYLLIFAILGTFTRVISKEDWRQFADWMSLKFMR